MVIDSRITLTGSEARLNNIGRGNERVTKPSIAPFFARHGVAQSASEISTLSTNPEHFRLLRPLGFAPKDFARKMLLPSEGQAIGRGFAVLETSRH